MELGAVMTRQLGPSGKQGGLHGQTGGVGVSSVCYNNPALVAQHFVAVGAHVNQLGHQEMPAVGNGYFVAARVAALCTAGVRAHERKVIYARVTQMHCF
jgi:hypothetical protein